MSQFSYPKKSRLLTKDDFLRMRRNSKKFVTKSLIFFVKENEYDYARLGFAISKKIGKANVRNRYRRVLREQFRLSENIRSRGLDILVVGKGKLNERKTELNEMIRQSYDQFINKI